MIFCVGSYLKKKNQNIKYFKEKHVNNKLLKKKKLEFKKIIVILTFVFATVWVSLSYVLSFLDKQPVESVSIAAISTLLAAIVAYCVASYKEKDSRNKYGYDEDGNPVNNVNTYSEGE